MPPKQATSTTRGRPSGSKNKPATASRASAGADQPSAKAKGKQRARPTESPEAQNENEQMDVDDDDEAQRVAEVSDDEEPEKSIPPDLLTRILHEFFEKDGTRITKDANNTVARYMDVFVKEAIARSAAEREGGFLEVQLTLAHILLAQTYSQGEVS